MLYAGSGKWQDRMCESQPAELDSRATTIQAELPDGVTVWYVNVFDDRNCAVSTQHQLAP